jgi:two-component system LytT family response regulator
LNILIVEDEPRAANRLARLIKDIQPKANIVNKISSVVATVAWLQANEEPDLIFLDVRLEDGESFDVFSQVDIQAPIVFCTAYHDYALRAFSVNSIDYLLKPVIRDQLARALSKYQRFIGVKMASGMWPQLITKQQSTQEKVSYRQQFLIAIAGKFTPLLVADINAAFSYHKSTQLVDNKGKEWFLDDALTEVEASLDLEYFFRVSRQWLVRLSAILNIHKTDSGYYIELECISNTIKVSRSKVRLLKSVLKV